MAGRYGNIDEVDTTGASQQTARQDNLNFAGVRASREMAQHDKNNMDKYKSMIMQAAKDHGMDASVIAGIISRETRAGAVLPSGGFGFDGHGYGLMQVDDRYHKLRGGPYSLENINQGTEILIDMIKTVKRNHPGWSQNMALKGGISAYNAGASKIQDYENVDARTTGHDYGNDVVARAQYYKSIGY